MDKWAELHTAYQVAKLGTVSAAAGALGLHRATINRHIDLLEAELAAKIFVRHARGYGLTDFGVELLQVAQKAEELLDDLAGRALGHNAQLGGEITLTVLPVFARLLFGPVARFRMEHPGCKVKILATEDLARLEYGEAQVALRAGRKPDHDDYVVRPFRSIKLDLYAHQTYVDRKGLPRGEHDLAGHDFIMLADASGRPPFASWIKDHVDPSQITVTCTDLGVLYDAVKSGVGLGFLSELEAEAHDGLHRVLTGAPRWHIPLWLVTHVDLHRTEKVQKMLTCLKNAA